MYITPQGSLVGYDGEGHKNFNPLRIYTSPAAVEWINKWFKLDDREKEIHNVIFEKKNFYQEDYEDKSIIISSTYHNESNLPKGYIENIKREQS